ncbi:MAG: glycosyltransferase, partial [Candidatus Krumholzibacteriia bacterium]
ARRAVRHPLVERYSKDVICVLSSSPPESIHIASAQIAERLGVTLCIDMRDGWLDEPLKPLLQQHGLQRWREGRLERRVLTRADKIIVTSPIWKELLGSRLGFTGKKTVLVTNAYPLIESDRGNEEDLDSTKRSATAPRPIHLVHAGRFTSSRYTQKPGYIFKLLDGAIERWGNGGVITLLGDLESEERKEIGSWRTSFQDKGWTLKFERSVPREQMLTTLRRADGLLLLSIARAAIPCKLFEYIPARKPILAVTSENSAVWCVGGGVPQMFLASYETPLDSTNVVVRFLEACRTGNYAADAPDIYSEVYLKNVFMNEVATGFAVSGAPHQR